MRNTIGYYCNFYSGSSLALCSMNKYIMAKYRAEVEYIRAGLAANQALLDSVVVGRFVFIAKGEYCLC